MTRTCEGGEAERASSKSQKSYVGTHVTRFSVVDVIGDGPLARVFRAEDTLGHLALKVFKQRIRFEGKSYSTEQLVRQARAAEALEHDGIINVQEIGQSHDVFYVAMELASDNVRDLVQSHGKLPVWEACSFALQAAEALAYAHHHGIVHGDIKPSNLLISASGHCKLGDFGMAPAGHDGTAFPLAVLGRPRCVAPEVLEGRPTTAQSDIYSLGATLFFMLAGRHVYDGKTYAEVVEEHRSLLIPDLRALRTDVSEELFAVILRAMARKPADRYGSAGELANALKPFAQTIGAMRFPEADQPEIQCEREPARPLPRRFVVGAVCATAAAILMIAVVLYLQLRSADAPKGRPTAVQTIAPESSEEMRANAVPAAAAGTPLVSATDMAALRDYASSAVAREVTVEGKVLRAQVGTAGDSVELSFTANDGGIRCICSGAKILEAMERAYGGNRGLGIQGRRVRLTGTLTMVNNAPQMVLTSIDQIEELP